MKSPVFSIFVYLSVVFLIVALIQYDYLNIPTIENPLYLTLSITLLLAGFVLNAAPWQRILQISGFPVSYRDSLASIGLSIFGKYIPGKIWAIIGRPSYIARSYDYPFNSLATLSLTAQIITIWSGLMIGVVGLLLVEGFEKWGTITIVLWLILTGILFTNSIHHITETICMKMFGKQLNIPFIPIRNILNVLPIFFLQWLTWCTAFYFLALSIYSHTISFAVGFGFALAASIGIISIVAPGGIGVREGFLVGFMSLAGYSVQDATTIAVASRLWFLMGEFFIFLLALLVNRSRHQ